MAHTTTSEWEQAVRFLEARRLEKPDAKNCFLVAVSGGLDSMCLLDFVHTWCRTHGGTMAAAHFHHQLRGSAADRDEAFVRSYCAAHEIPFFAGRGDTRVSAKQNGLSIEEAARTLRYAFLEKTANNAGYAWILTAHHADDNAETMLLHLIRGAGSRGLSGIPPVRGRIARPFLTVSKQQLEAYAALHEIPHVEDETNADPAAASRNALRQTVLPVLRTLNPRAVEHMSRTADIVRRENDVLDAYAAQLSAQAHPVPDGLCINASVFADAPAVVSERAVLSLLSAVCGQRKDLTAVHVRVVLDLACGGASNRERTLPHRLLIRRAGDMLWILRRAQPAADVSAAVGETVAYGAWTAALCCTGGQYALSVPPDAALTLTGWRSSDRMTLPGQAGPRSLKRLCVDRGIPPFRRDLLPVLRIGGLPAAVPGIGVDVRFAPESGRASLYVTFENRENHTENQTEENEHGQ